MNNLITPTNGNNAANKSYVDGIKQAATWYLYLYTFLNYEMGQYIEEVTEFLKSRSKYGISNDLDFTA